MQNYPEGECTWYVAHYWLDKYKNDVLFFPKTSARHAKTWPDRARAAGLTVTNDVHQAVMGCVAVFEIGPYGHVAIVDKENDNGSLNVSESNYAGPHIFGRRLNVKTPATFILPPSDGGEFAKAWQRMKELGVYTDSTASDGQPITAERLAVFLSRFYDKVKTS